MSEEMRFTQDCIELVKEHEGCILHAYQDMRGIWTIGYGHTKGVHEGMTCSEAQALAWLNADLTEAAADVKRVLMRTMNNNQFGALVSFVFNLGIGDLEGSTLLKLIHQEQIYKAADEFPKWDHCLNPKTGKREEVAGLLARRNDERKLFLKPTLILKA